MHQNHPHSELLTYIHTFLYSSLVNHVGRYFYIFPHHVGRYGNTPPRECIILQKSLFLQGRYDFQSKIHPRGSVFPYLPCKIQNLIFGCLNYIGMPYLPNRVGRYKKPTPWVKFFPLRLRRAGKNLYPWGRYFIPPRPIGQVRYICILTKKFRENNIVFPTTVDFTNILKHFQEENDSVCSLDSFYKM